MIANQQAGRLIGILTRGAALRDKAAKVAVALLVNYRLGFKGLSLAF